VRSTPGVSIMDTNVVLLQRGAWFVREGSWYNGGRAPRGSDRPVRASCEQPRARGTAGGARVAPGRGWRRRRTGRRGCRREWRGRGGMTWRTWRRNSSSSTRLGTGKSAGGTDCARDCAHDHLNPAIQGHTPPNVRNETPSINPELIEGASHRGGLMRPLLCR
jgi:hypothetical protein